MKILNQNMTIRDYKAALDRGDIVINRDYQRSDQVWPVAAKSYLIETIILDYPVPKLFLHQTVDVKTRGAIKQVVDGQQRTRAIADFINNKLTLSKTLGTDRLREASFDDLEEDDRELFLNYGLSIDLFTAASVEEVIEVFRRMNSYTVPLNPEEKRHALYQGAFKWFVNAMTKQMQPYFMRCGTFSEKQIVRMQDAKLITEIVDAYCSGIRTTNTKTLDNLYKKHDQAFEEEEPISNDLMAAVNLVSQWTDLHKGPIVKPYQMYCLLLAIVHMQRAIPTLQSLFRSPELAIDTNVALPSLTRLAAAVEDDVTERPYSNFISASTERTNVKSQRENRFVWFCHALIGTVPA